MFLRATALCAGYSGFGASLLAGGLVETTPRWFLRVVTRQPMDRSNRSPLYADQRTSSDRPGMSEKCHNQKRVYSINSSAATNRVCGTLRPSTLAVLRLITNSNLVGCSTGKSAGLVPFKILSTNTAARFHISITFGP